jgi:hypothetical protein
MCQLNAFLISKEIPQELIISLMNQFDMEGECITKEIELNEIYNKYNIYINSPYRCDCGSFVTKFSDPSYNGLNIMEILKNRNREKVIRLNKIRDFISKDTYEEDKLEFLEKYNILHPKVIAKENEFLMKYNESADAFLKIKNEISKSVLHNEWNEFIKKNKQMYDSIFLYSIELNI